MFELNNFDSMQIGLASPEKIREWSYGEVTNQKPLTTEHKNLKEMVCSAKESLDLQKTGNVIVENIKEFVIKA